MLKWKLKYIKNLFILAIWGFSKEKFKTTLKKLKLNFAQWSYIDKL